MDLKRLNISEKTLAALNKKHLFTVSERTKEENGNWKNLSGFLFQGQHGL